MPHPVPSLKNFASKALTALLRREARNFSSRAVYLCQAFFSGRDQGALKPEAGAENADAVVQYAANCGLPIDNLLEQYGAFVAEVGPFSSIN